MTKWRRPNRRSLAPVKIRRSKKAHLRALAEKLKARLYRLYVVHEFTDLVRRAEFSGSEIEPLGGPR